MTQSSWPFDGTDTTETQYSYLFRRLQTNGVWGTAETTDLKPFADSSGMNVKLNVGFANIRGFIYNNDALLTLTVQPADAQPRIDSLILLLDLTGNAITAQVKKGTAASTPSSPTISQPETGNYELELGQVYVPANAVSVQASNVTDTRSFMAHHFGVWTTVKRPSSPRRGLPGFNLTTGLPEYWDGTKWSNFAPPTIDASTLNTGTLPNSVLPNRLSAVSADNIVTDWNQATQTGWYVSQNGASNSPDTNKWWAGEVITYAGSLLVQTLIWYSETSAATGTMRRIRTSAGVWGSWYRAGMTAAEATALGDLATGKYLTKDQMLPTSGAGSLDARYYTESEIDAKLATKINTGSNTVTQAELPFRSAGGTLTMAPAGSAKPYTDQKHITFPGGRFTGTPVVMLTPLTQSTTAMGWGTANADKNGFDLFFWRDSNVNTGMSWLAYDSVNS